MWCGTRARYLGGLAGAELLAPASLPSRFAPGAYLTLFKFLRRWPYSFRPLAHRLPACLPVPHTSTYTILLTLSYYPLVYRRHGSCRRPITPHPVDSRLRCTQLRIHLGRGGSVTSPGVLQLAA